MIQIRLYLLGELIVHDSKNLMLSLVCRITDSAQIVTFFPLQNHGQVAPLDPPLHSDRQPAHTPAGRLCCWPQPPHPAASRDVVRFWRGNSCRSSDCRRVLQIPQGCSVGFVQALHQLGGLATGTWSLLHESLLPLRAGARALCEKGRPGSDQSLSAISTPDIER